MSIVGTDEWMESSGEFKGGVTSSRVDTIVMAELSQWKPFGPIILFVVDIKTKILFQFLIGALGLTIGLRMEGSGQIACDPSSMTYILPEGGGELRTTIADNLAWKSVLTEDTLNKVFGETSSIQSLVHGNKDDRL